jgi:cytochrome c peroxidase
MGVFLLGAAAARDAWATNHEIGITEIGAGVNNDPNAQFIEIRMIENGQNEWGPGTGESQSRAMLEFFDGTGAKTGEFKFTANAPNMPNRFILIGTQAFANLTNQPDPDIIIPALIKTGSGRVCFRSNDANTNAFQIAECVAYGSFPAAQNHLTVGTEFPATFDFGTPVQANLPITGFQSLRRFETGETGDFGLGFKDTDSNNADFFLSSSPNPTRSGGSFTPDDPGDVAAGQVLFTQETFGGNGRTCATCHVIALNGALPPSNVQARFGTLSTTFDTLFIAEPNMNLNTLTVDRTVTFADGAVLNVIAGGVPGKVKVRATLSGNTFLVHGGIAPRVDPGTQVSDGTHTALAVSIVKGDLDQLESPHMMRDPSSDPKFPQGRALILENIDGFNKPPVFRKSPHLQNLRFTGPFGFSNDIPTLQAFAVGAVRQHFPRTLQRREGIDFRLPTGEEQNQMAAFMRSLESIPGGDPLTKFTLGNFARTAQQKRGRDIFQAQGCARCHSSPVLSGGAFQTGINKQPIDQPPPNGDGLPLDSDPNDPNATTNRAIGAPPLFNVRRNGPFFHEASRATLLDAVNFYLSPTFQESPEGPTFPISFDTNGANDLVAFLESLEARDFTVLDGTVDVTQEGTTIDFGDRFAGDPQLTRQLTVKNTSTTASVKFATNACNVTGNPGQAFNPAEFPAADCTQLNGATLAPGQSKVITVRFDPTSSGRKTAILEIIPAALAAPAFTPAATGVDLVGRGLIAEVDERFDSEEFSNPPRFTNQLLDSFWFVNAGQLNGSSCFTCPSPQGNLLTHDFTLPTSFTVEVDGIAEETFSAVNDFSVIFNFQNTSNYYYASFNEKDTRSDGSDDPNTNGIFKVVNGVRTQIRDFADTTTPGDFFAPLHHVRIEKIKSTIRVFRDDVLMGVVTDTTFTGGKAGVGSFNDNTRFDNFLVKAHVIGEDHTTTTNPYLKILGGTFTVTGGKLQLTSPATGTTLPNSNLAVHTTSGPSGDFELFVDGNAIATSGTADDFTVVFNFQNATNYMFANFNETNDSAANGLFKVVNSVRTQIMDFSSTTAGGTPRRISIRRAGATIKVFRDGVQMGSDVNDSTFSGGQVGVGSRNDAGTFDNFFVERPR